MNPTAIADFLILDSNIDLSTGQGIIRRNSPFLGKQIWVDFPLGMAGRRYLLQFLILSVSLSGIDRFSTKKPCFFCGNVIKFRLRDYAQKSSDFYCFYLKRVRTTPHNLTRRLSQDFCFNSKFEKRRNSVYTRKGYAASVSQLALATAALYFSFFKLKKWGKKTAETCRHNCAVLP